MLEYTNNWVKGEVTQGWIMLVAGILFAIASYYIWKADTSMVRGMLIPLVLVTLICLGYGSNLVWGRPAKAKALTTAYQQNASATIQEETARLEKETATYSMTIKGWVVTIVIGLLLYFFMSAGYYKGLGIGILLFGAIALLTDIFLSKRVAVYLEQIQNL